MVGLSLSVTSEPRVSRPKRALSVFVGAVFGCCIDIGAYLAPGFPSEEDFCLAPGIVQTMEQGLLYAAAHVESRDESIQSTKYHLRNVTL